MKVDTTSSHSPATPAPATNPLLQLQKLPNLVKNITDSIFWIAQKNILMTKNVLLERLDTILNQSIFEEDGNGGKPAFSPGKDVQLEDQIESIYQLRDTYVNLGKALSNLISKNMIVSDTRNEIGEILKSEQFHLSCKSLEKLGLGAGGVFQSLGSLMMKYNEKLLLLQKSIDTFVSHAMQVKSI